MVALVTACSAGLAQPTTPERAAPGTSWILRSSGVVRLTDGRLEALPGRGPADPVQRRLWLPRSLRARIVPSALAATADLSHVPFQLRTMARQALADLDVLTLADGTALASIAPNWRYHWPRDAAFVALALTVYGAADRGLSVLQRSVGCLSPDGTLEARYLPGSCSPPDHRGAQLDGLGWTLWALDQWRHLAPGQVAADRARTVQHMASALARGLTRHLDPVTGLPSASPDYWEVPTSALTLGTAAPVTSGLCAASRLLSDVAEGRALHMAARRAHASLRTSFGTRGWPRRADRPGLDCGVAMVFPPFLAGTGATDQVRDRARTRLAVPIGGIRPGEDWHDWLTSWTPELALFTLVDACAGQRDKALGDLRFLSQHLTVADSLPEKINGSGAPAGAAPLAWTAALVLLTLSVLAGTDLTPPTL